MLRTSGTHADSESFLFIVGLWGYEPILLISAVQKFDASGEPVTIEICDIQLTQ
jgi:hypothetical protein